ncbi:MAG: hypothetical protein AB9M60_24040 [Leptothrix sp. (in: b-proteobacteria)]
MGQAEEWVEIPSVSNCNLTLAERPPKRLNKTAGFLMPLQEIQAFGSGFSDQMAFFQLRRAIRVNCLKLGALASGFIQVGVLPDGRVEARLSLFV